MADNKKDFTNYNNENITPTPAYEPESKIGSSVYNTINNISSVEGISLNNNPEDTININPDVNRPAVSPENNINTSPIGESARDDNFVNRDENVSENETIHKVVDNGTNDNEADVKSRVSSVLNKAFNDKNKERKESITRDTDEIPERTGKRKSFANRLEKVSNNEKGLDEIKNKNFEGVEEDNVVYDTPTEIFEKVETVVENDVANEDRNNLNGVSNNIIESNSVYVETSDDKDYNDEELVGNNDTNVVTNPEKEVNTQVIDDKLETTVEETEDGLDKAEKSLTDFGANEDNIEYGNSHSTYDKVLDDEVSDDVDQTALELERENVEYDKEDSNEESPDYENDFYEEDEEYDDEYYYDGEDDDYDDSDSYTYEDDIEEESYLDDGYIDDEDTKDYTEERKKKVENGTYNEENEFDGRLLDDLEDLDDSENDMYNEWTKNEKSYEGETLLDVLQKINSNLELIAKALGAK